MSEWKEERDAKQIKVSNHGERVKLIEKIKHRRVNFSIHRVTRGQFKVVGSRNIGVKRVISITASFLHFFLSFF